MVALLPPFGSAALLASTPARPSVVSVEWIGSDTARWTFSEDFTEFPGDASACIIDGESPAGVSPVGGGVIDCLYPTDHAPGDPWDFNQALGWDGVFTSGLDPLPQSGVVV